MKNDERRAPFTKFNYALEVKSPVFDKYVDDLFARLNITHQKQARARALRAILLNLIFSFYDSVGVYRTTSYTPCKRENPFSIGQRALCSVLDLLESNKYIHQAIGDKTKDTITTIKFCDSLREELRENNILAYWEMPGGLILTSKGDPVVLKTKKDKDNNENGRTIDYEDSAYTRRVRKGLKEYQSFMQEYEIWLEYENGEMSELPEFSVKRTFNNSCFSQGGRISGYWVSIPKGERKFLRIEDEKCKEYDLEASGLNFLYRRVTGKPCPNKEPYAAEFKGKQIPRKFSKLYLNVAQNTKKNGMHNAYMEELEKRAQKKEFNSLELSWSDFCSAIESKHKPILDYLYQPKIGMETQWCESEFVFICLGKLINEGIPVLPVYDSFIVRELDFDKTKKLVSDTLEQNMEDYLIAV